MLLPSKDIRIKISNVSFNSAVDEIMRQLDTENMKPYSYFDTLDVDDPTNIGAWDEVEEEFKNIRNEIMGYLTLLSDEELDQILQTAPPEIHKWMQDEDFTGALEAGFFDKKGMIISAIGKAIDNRIEASHLFKNNFSDKIDYSQDFLPGDLTFPEEWK